MTWELLFKGILLGMSLSILVGPILIAIVQTSIEQGKQAGLTVATGIWFSDILFILSVYLGIATIQRLTDWEGFELTMGVVGGIILMLFGLGTMLAKAPDMNVWDKGGFPQDAPWKLWIKGFLINTVNPFTLFFWISVTSTVVIDGGLSSTHACLFYGGLLGTVMATDAIKILFADWIRSRMKPQSMIWLRRISGGALILFGIALVVRVVM